MAPYLEKAERMVKIAKIWLNHYLVVKSPYQIPSKAKEWIVTYVPWIDLVLLVLLLPVLLVTLGIGTFLVPLSIIGGYHFTFGVVLALLFLIGQLGLMIAALPGLFACRVQGWDFLFYGLVLNLIYNLLELQILSLILNAVIGGYLLFQIRTYYK